MKLRDIWAIRTKLQMSHKSRDLALFNLAIDSKLRGCDLVALRVRDISNGAHVLSRAMVIQRKTNNPVKFEITEPTRDAIEKWVEQSNLGMQQYLFPSRKDQEKHITTRQYSRIVKSWAQLASREPSDYGTHSLRRTKATLIYRRTKNLRAVQISLGHTKIESTVRYLGIEVDDALEMAEQTEI